MDNDEDNEFDISDDPHEKLKIHVLPLYSQLPMEQQSRVFEPPPEGSRLIILATNVAETSLTIPGIKYVIDCGRAKEKKFDRTTGIQTFDIGWISKASASQRAGRAGRTGPGHCYRLYSSAYYEHSFPEFAEPEIQRTPVEGVVLQLKSMGIPKITNFPFPTPPSRESLLQAERLLENLGALLDGKVTDVGRNIAVYPLSPRLSRILTVAAVHDCLGHAATMVAALGVGDIFIAENQLDMADTRPADETWTEADNIAAQQREQKRKDYNAFHGNVSRLDRTSDAIKLLTAVCDFSAADESTMASFRKFTRAKALQEAVQLRFQLASIVKSHNPTANISTSANQAIPVPSASQIKLLRGILVMGYVDQIALRADSSPSRPLSTRKPKRSIDVPYVTLSPSHVGKPSKTEHGEDRPEDMYVYVHPSSILTHTTSAAKMPQYLVYSHISRGAPSHVAADGAGVRTPKARIHPLTPTVPAHIIAAAKGTPLLDEGKPVGRIETLPRGRDGKERRQVATVPFLRPGAQAGVGWPLPPARTVVQKRDGPKGWVVEREVV